MRRKTQRTTDRFYANIEKGSAAFKEARTHRKKVLEHLQGRVGSPYPLTEHTLRQLRKLIDLEKAFKKKCNSTKKARRADINARTRSTRRIAKRMRKKK